MSVVQGHCDPAFQGVRDVFEASFTDGGNFGAGVTVFSDGKPVVDLWGGTADARTGRLWERDTPCVAFSCTKAVTATAVNLLAERGDVDLTAKVTDWWPEYGVNGKENTTGEHFLSHQAGVPAFDRPVSAEEAADPVAMAELLAAQTPEWEPGTAHGYHALTYGWLAGELVRRHTGKTVGEFVREEFGPELWIGSPQHVIDKAARLITKGRLPAGAADPGDLLTRLAEAFVDPNSSMNRALNNPATSYNKPIVLSGGWPGAGMVATPRALAGFYNDLLQGKILKNLAESIRPRVRGTDRVMLVDSCFALGYQRPSMMYFMPKEARPTAFGHAGAGGAVGLGDPEKGLAVAYIPNLMADAGSTDLRAFHLVEAAYRAVR